MNSEKLLLKALASLADVYEEFSWKADTIDRKAAFESTVSQCNGIYHMVKAGEIGAARNQWYALMHFSSDSIALSESFLGKYEPLKQKIINFGLQ